MHTSIHTYMHTPWTTWAAVGIIEPMVPNVMGPMGPHGSLMGSMVPYETPWGPLRPNGSIGFMGQLGRQPGSPMGSMVPHETPWGHMGPMGPLAAQRLNELHGAAGALPSRKLLNC